MEVGRFMARVCTISIPTWVSENVQNWQIINRISMKMCPSTEGVKFPSVHLSSLEMLGFHGTMQETSLCMIKKVNFLQCDD